MTVKTYDAKCFNLADVFLCDEPGYLSLSRGQKDALCDQIAKDIQDAIESAISDARDNGRFAKAEWPA